MCEYERNVGNIKKKKSKCSDHLHIFTFVWRVAAMVKGQKYIVVKNLACFDKTMNSIKSHFTQDALEGFST